MMEKPIAYGIKASATTIPARTSRRTSARLENHWLFKRENVIEYQKQAQDASSSCGRQKVVQMLCCPADRRPE